MGEAPDIREQEDCPSGDVCDWMCDQHESEAAQVDEKARRLLMEIFGSPSQRAKASGDAGEGGGS